MKGLKKIALCTAVAVAPFAAQAELKALDDTAMGSVTGQAGVTIDLEARVSVGEIAYQDQGFLAVTDMTIGGAAPGSALDNIRLTIDVAGDPTSSAGTDLGVAGLGSAYLAGAGATVTGLTEVDQNALVSDGDLVISLRSQDPTEAVDYGIGIEEVSLAQSDGTIGDLTSTSNTVLVSDLNMTGTLGPVDILIHEDTSNLNINAFFNATGSLNMPFMGTSMDFELHNRRGTSVVNAGALGSFAHAQVDIGVESDYDIDKDGTGDQDALRVTVQDFSGDLDLKNITPGGVDSSGNPTSAASIGSLYLTDLAVSADMVIYGH